MSFKHSQPSASEYKCTALRVGDALRVTLLCCAWCATCRRHVDAIGDLAIEHYHELANKITPSLGVQAWRTFNGWVERNWVFRCALDTLAESINQNM